MVVIGIDLLIMMLLWILCMLVTTIVTMMLPLTEEQGWSAILASTFTGLMMVVGYIAMAHVLDWVLDVWF